VCVDREAGAFTRWLPSLLSPQPRAAGLMLTAGVEMGVESCSVVCGILRRRVGGAHRKQCWCFLAETTTKPLKAYAQESVEDGWVVLLLPPVAYGREMSKRDVKPPTPTPVSPDGERLRTQRDQEIPTLFLDLKGRAKRAFLAPEVRVVMDRPCVPKDFLPPRLP
jgi:hypothetical protein